MPPRAHRHVERAGVQHVVGGLPADGFADLDGGARAVGLVAGRVGTVVEHTVLHVDEPGEGQMREQLAPALALGEQAEEHAVGLEHVAALHERQPVVEALLERAVE